MPRRCVRHHRLGRPINCVEQLVTCLGEPYNPRDIVRLNAANEEFNIDADHERLSLARQHNSPHLWISRRLVERLLQLMDNNRVQFIEHIGSVDSNRGNAIGHCKLYER